MQNFIKLADMISYCIIHNNDALYNMHTINVTGLSNNKNTEDQNPTSSVSISLHSYIINKNV